VLRSPAGETRATLHFPFDKQQLETRLEGLAEGLAVQDFGKALFDALISGEARSLYDVSLAKAAESHKGLRVKLRIASPALAALPWELLYDARRGQYVCLSVNTPLIRYLKLPQPPQPLEVTPPLRILGMIASPSDLPRLDVDREKTRVEQALAGLMSRGLVDLVWLPGQTRRDLQQAMRRGQWHVFHFVGHGAFDTKADQSLVMLADDEGKAQPLRAAELGRLLADHPDLRLAVLNACEGAKGGGLDIFSSTASILVRQGLPAVLAMQFAVTDQVAVELSRVFYESLADGLPVDAAVTEARKAVSLAVSSTLDWATRCSTCGHRMASCLTYPASKILRLRPVLPPTRACNTLTWPMPPTSSAARP
jgi:CHAT domain-containing protein